MPPTKSLGVHHPLNPLKKFQNANPNLNVVAQQIDSCASYACPEMMAIHHTLQLLTTTYRGEPTHIFTNCLIFRYLLNTQIKHTTLHNNHPYKNILESMIIMLQSHTQTTTLHKVKAHTNMNGNEQADALAKSGCELDHRDDVTPYKHARPTSYYLQKD